MVKASMRPDERSVGIALRVCTFFYVSTLVALMVVIGYRQFVLGQPTTEYDDIAMILTVNVIGLTGGLFYLGGITVERIRIRTVLLAYVGFVLLGLLFTFVKYNILLNERLGIGELGEKFFIVAAICGIMLLGWLGAAFLGTIRMKKFME